MAPSKQSGEGLLQWAAGTRWGQGGWAALWKISSLWATGSFAGAVLSLAGSEGQSLLPPAHSISHSAFPPGEAERNGWAPEQDQAKGTKVRETREEGRRTWVISACPLSWPEMSPFL